MLAGLDEAPASPVWRSYGGSWRNCSAGARRSLTASISFKPWSQREPHRGAKPMSEPITTDVSTERPWEHPAVKAWSELQSNGAERGSIEILKRKNKSKRCEPDSIEVLKCKKKSAV